MKKLLCTASLLLAFSMSSFANTNDMELVKTSEKKEATISGRISSDPCIVTIKTVVVTGEPDATSASDGIIITVITTTINICDPIGPIRPIRPTR